MVLTRDEVIDRLNEIIVAPVTRTIRGLRTEVLLTEEDGMPAACAVNFDHLSLAGGIASRLCCVPCLSSAGLRYESIADWVWLRSRSKSLPSPATNCDTASFRRSLTPWGTGSRVGDIEIHATELRAGSASSGKRGWRHFAERRILAVDPVDGVSRRNLWCRLHPWMPGQWPICRS